MKSSLLRCGVGCGAAFALAWSVSATTAVFESGPLNGWIPDNSATGLVSTITVPDTGLVTGVSVQFELSVPDGEAGWLGDLYAYLRHDDGFAVLLNRPGATATNPFGYSDSQAMQVTFADTALNDDVHRYRAEVNGGESTSLVGALFGTWAPDGRAVDPDAVFDTTPRTALLGGFEGHSLGGSWTLFVADLSGGGQHQLDRWGLTFEVQTAEVPEAGGGAAALVLGLLALLHRFGRRHR